MCVLEYTGSGPHTTHTAAVLTCFREPGGGRVGVDGAEAHHLVELGALADRHADQRVGLLRHHQHLKDLQRTRQREVDVLRGRREKYKAELYETEEQVPSRFISSTIFSPQVENKGG